LHVGRPALSVLIGWSSLNLSNIADDVSVSAILTMLNVSLAPSFAELTNYYRALPAHFYFRQK
jgi:hypothetical protein